MRITAFGLAFVLAASAPCVSADNTFEDGEFNGSAWAEVVAWDTSGTLVSSALQMRKGGFPGSWREVRHSTDAGHPNQNIGLAHIYTEQTFDPSTDGLLETLSFSIDVIVMAAGTSKAVGFMLAARQSGTIFRLPESYFAQAQFTGWTPHTYEGLLAADLVSPWPDGEQTLDLSKSGALIEFGVISQNGTFTNNPISSASGFDNWHVVAHCSTDCPWDLDGKMGVGITDFLSLLAQWGTDPGGPPDFDGNGNVGIEDFLALLANWGPCP